MEAERDLEDPGDLEPSFSGSASSSATGGRGIGDRDLDFFLAFLTFLFVGSGQSLKTIGNYILQIPT